LKKLLLALVACSVALPALADVTVVPANATYTDPVRIRVANTFGSEAGVVSESISRNGNAFAVQQQVHLICALASNPVVESQFDVGVLPPGTYTVTATLTFTGSPPNTGCSRPPLTQTTSFIVAPPVPALENWTLLLLAAVLAASAVVALGR
jgi:hypothetical protein